MDILDDKGSQSQSS